MNFLRQPPNRSADNPVRRGGIPADAAGPRPTGGSISRFWLRAALAFLLTLAVSGRAQLTIQASHTVAFTIPDDEDSGVQRSLSVSAPWVSIGSVHVDLRIESVNVNNPVFNGDLYVQLTHTDSGNQSGKVVLLNRVGRSGTSSFGYSDQGFDVTFSDAASQGDIHGYRTALYGNEGSAIPSPGILTGMWRPDGRETDPDLVVSSDSRTALLSEFNGLNPNGLWTLFVADLSGGGEAKVVSWGITLVAVPEPSGSVLAVTTALCAWTVIRRKHRRHPSQG